MKRTDTVRKISKPTANFRRGKGIWLQTLECPTCGNIKQPPRNQAEGKKFFCDGRPGKKQKDLNVLRSGSKSLE